MQKRRMLLLILMVLLVHPVWAQRPTPLTIPVDSENPLPTYGALVQIQSRNESAILARPGVRGIGIGRQGLLALVFHIYVAQGTQSANLPTQIEGVPVRVIPVGPFKALTGLMGTSTSNGNGCFAGTLGLRVFDGNNPGHAGYVTNNHVAAMGTNQCVNTASIGTPEYSPGTGDNNCQNGTEIGKLSRFVAISFAPSAFNRVDAAFVENSGDGPDERTDCGLCFPPTTPITPLNALGTTVRKCGRTTHLTSGTVTTTISPPASLTAIAASPLTTSRSSSRAAAPSPIMATPDRLSTARTVLSVSSSPATRPPIPPSSTRSPTSSRSSM
jgi:hypothetical protein